MTLYAAIDEFIEDRRTFCTSKTVSNYRNTLRYFSDFVYSCSGSGSVDLESLRSEDIRKYIIYLRSKEKLSNHPYKPTISSCITDTSVRTYLIDVRAFFNYHVRAGNLSSSPFSGIRLLRRDKKVIIPISQVDVNKIEIYFKSVYGYYSYRNPLILHFFLDSGIRLHELINLKWSDINTENNYIMIYGGKGRKDRYIPLCSRLRKLFLEFKNLYRKRSGEYVFSFQQKQITEYSIKMIFQRIRDNCGIDTFYPHLCRHTFATSFIMAGGDISILAIYMGHESITTTQNYLHIANFCKLTGFDIYKIDKSLVKPFY